MKLKKLLSLMISSVFVITTTNSTLASIGININNKSIESDAEPQIIDGRTMVPVRAIFEGVEADVNWNAKTKTITGKKGNITVVMKIGEKFITINDKNLHMDSAAMIINERAYAPARYVAEAFGYDVAWDSDLKEVNIKDRNINTSTTEATTKNITEKATEITTKGLTEKTTEITTKKATDKKTEVKESTTKANAVTTEKSTETTTMSAADILNSSPIEGVGAATYKLIKNDTNNAFKLYYVGNANSNNRFQRPVYNKLMEVWTSTAKTDEEKKFVTHSKSVYTNMITTCKRIDQRKAKYPSNANIDKYCRERRTKLEELLKTYFTSKNLEEVKNNAEKIKKFAAATVNK